VRSLAGANPEVGARPGTPATTGSPRLRYMPALDGVRAFAVLSVMAYHGGVSFLPAGFFGVDAFFVLSGFLITTLLVTEWSGTHRIGLRAFWARRARRLLPALLLMLLFVLLYARFVAAPGTYPGLRWDSIAALFYCANWRFIVSGQNYFVQSGPVSPLLHTWSLAIEEQFYIVWPILVLAIMRLRHGRSGRALQILLAVSVIGALASAIEMALLYNPSADPTRLYFGTDTHAQCMLVGAALATAIALWRGRQAPPLSSRVGVLLSVIGLLGVAICAWAWSQLQYGQAFVFQGGFLLVALSVAAVILSAVLHPTGIVARALSWAPLRFIGTISYGMYLWHFPLDIALTGQRTGLSGTPLFLFRTLVTVAVSTLSFYLLERPIRSGRLLSVARARVVTPVAVIGMAVLVFATTVPATTAGAVPTGTAPQTTLPGGSGQTGPASLANAPVRVMLVGDSVASSLGVGVYADESKWHIQEENLAILGCGVAQGGGVWDDIQGQQVWVPVAYPCRLHPAKGDVPWTTAWVNWLREVRPNVLVLLAGRWEVVDRLYKGRRINILNPIFSAYVKSQLERAVHIGTSTGARMVLMTAPCFDRGEQANGTPWPQDNIRRVEVYNELVHQVGEEFPTTVTVQDLFPLACPGGKFTPTLNGVQLRDPDGIHFAYSANGGAQLLAPSILPLWEDLGHRQEAGGGHVITGPVPSLAHLSPP
jgi:peptidoglycan/LPS O-acetylase OafA/YrhL